MANPEKNQFNGQPILIPNRKRGYEKVRMVREELNEDGTVRTVIDAMMPVGKGFNQGGGVDDYKKMNVGWMTYEEYEDRKRVKAIKDKQEAEIEALKKEVEELKVKKSAKAGV